MKERHRNFNSAYLHVYGQEEWHNDVRIVGDEKALKALRDAIDAAIGRGTTSAGTVFTADGEGYYVTVIRLNDPQTWRRLAVPYTNELARETREEAVWPESLLHNMEPEG